MAKQRHIILVGFMGTGKTTVGELLARRLGRRMIDTDHDLEERRGKSIADIFRTEGEARFRELEHRILADWVHSPVPLVVTTGGGIVLRPDNVTLMKERGWVVALQAERDALIRRLRQDTSRPLLAGDLEKRIDHLLAERRHAYDFADVTVDTSHRTPGEVVEVIMNKYRAQ